MCMFFITVLHFPSYSRMLCVCSSLLYFTFPPTPACYVYVLHYCTSLSLLLPHVMCTFFITVLHFPSYSRMLCVRSLLLYFTFPPTPACYVYVLYYCTSLSLLLPHVMCTFFITVLHFPSY